MSHDLRWDGTQVLVTGAGGFLGRALCRRLVAEGAAVVGVWRSEARPAPPGVVGRQVELTAPGAVEALVEEVGPAVVLHLAAPVNVSRDPEGFPAMAEGILRVSDRLARACLRRRARLLYVGTCEEYGDGRAPFEEEQVLRPVSPYSAAKAAAGSWVLCLARTAGLEAAVVRPFLTYGPGQAPGPLIPSAVEAALDGRALPMTDGGQSREVNFVEDMARGLALAAASGAALGRALNLGGGPELPVLELARRIYTLAGADPGLIQAGALPRRPGEVASRFVGDHTLARRLLGFVPEVGLDEGLRRTIAAHREERQRERRPG